MFALPPQSENLLYSISIKPMEIITTDEETISTRYPDLILKHKENKFYSRSVLPITADNTVPLTDEECITEATRILRDKKILYVKDVDYYNLNLLHERLNKTIFS
jgi:hypothetical protein